MEKIESEVPLNIEKKFPPLNEIKENHSFGKAKTGK